MSDSGNKRPEDLLNEQDLEIRAMLMHNCMEKIAQKLIAEGKPLENFLKKSFAEELKDPNSKINKEVAAQQVFDAFTLEQVQQQLTMFYIREQAFLDKFREKIHSDYEESKIRAAEFMELRPGEKNSLQEEKPILTEPVKRDRWRDGYYSGKLKDLEKQETEMAARHSKAQADNFYKSIDSILDHMTKRLEELPLTKQTREAIEKMTQLRQKNKENEARASKVEDFIKTHRPDIDTERDAKQIANRSALNSQFQHNNITREVKKAINSHAETAPLKQELDKVTIAESNILDNLLKEQVKEIKEIKDEIKTTKEILNSPTYKSENKLPKPPSQSPDVVNNNDFKGPKPD